MSDQRCETCAYWRAPESWLRDKRAACHRIMPGGAPLDMPYVQSTEATGRLVTPPSFSCALWRPKEADDA